MFLQIVQILLLILFVMAGMMKMLVPKQKFNKKMPWAKKYSSGQLKAIGFFEVLGALGITLPLWLDIQPWLTPVAAIALAVVVLLALQMHAARKEWGTVVMTSVVLGLLAYVIVETWSLLSF